MAEEGPESTTNIAAKSDKIQKRIYKNRFPEFGSTVHGNVQNDFRRRNCPEVSSKELETMPSGRPEDPVK